MPGYEVIGEEEKNEILDLFDNGGILFRHGFDSLRNNCYKVKEFEASFARAVCSEVGGRSTGLKLSDGEVAGQRRLVTGRCVVAAPDQPAPEQPEDESQGRNEKSPPCAPRRSASVRVGRRCPFDGVNTHLQPPPRWARCLLAPSTSHRSRCHGRSGRG